MHNIFKLKIFNININKNGIYFNNYTYNSRINDFHMVWENKIKEISEKNKDENFPFFNQN